MNDPVAALDRASEIGRFHVAATRLDRPGSFALRQDEVVPIASMYKVLLALEVAEAFHDGRLAPQQEVRVTGEQHCPGGLGLNQFANPVTLSLHDVLYLSLAWSDNTASDLLLDRVGLEAVHGRADLLGLSTLIVPGGCRRLLRDAGEDLGYASEAAAVAADWTPRSDDADLDLTRTTRASVSDLARLAGMIDAGRAAHPDACRTVREVMARQIWTTRFASAFSLPAWSLSSKTGTHSPWRGELGIITREDGARVALAVVVRQHSARASESVVDAAVASVASAAVGLALDARAPATA